MDKGNCDVTDGVSPDAAGISSLNIFWLYNSFWDKTTFFLNGVESGYYFGKLDFSRADNIASVDLAQTVSFAVDNGTEFSDYKGMTKGDRTKVYYCHPYSMDYFNAY